MCTSFEQERRLMNLTGCGIAGQEICWHYLPTSSSPSPLAGGFVGEQNLESKAFVYYYN